MPLPSFAGQWVITYEETQTQNYLQPTSLPDSGDTVPVTNSWYQALDGPNFYDGSVGNSWYQSTNLSLSVTDAVVATLTWVPGSGQTMASDPPPAKLILDETAHAWWEADWGAGGPPADAGTASNGLGDAEVFTIPPKTTVGQGTSAGSHLVQVDSSSGVVKRYCTLSAQNPDSVWMYGLYNPYYGRGYWWSWSEESYEYAYKVAQDMRAVTISSSLGQTYHKGSQTDAHGVALPEADTPTTYGVGLATTVVPYVNSPSADTTPDGNCSSNIIYTAHPVGSWADESTYQWAAKIGSTNGQTLSGPFGSNMPPGDLGLQYVPADEPGGNVSAGKQEQVTITLKDAQDGADATNTYNVTFHDPTENWVLWDSENPFWQGATADSIPDPGYALHNAGITGTWEYTDTVWAEAAEAFTEVGSHAVGENPYWASFLTAASIAFSKVQPQQVQQTVNFNDAWTDSNSTFDPKPADSTQDTMTHYKMVPELYVQYEPQIWRGDGYAASGYTGGVQTAIDKFLQADTAGDFTLITSDPTGGN